MCITNRGTKRIASAPALAYVPLEGSGGGMVASGGFWAPGGIGAGAFGGNGLLTVRDFSAAAIAKSKETPSLPTEVTIVRNNIVKPAATDSLPGSSSSSIATGGTCVSSAAHETCTIRPPLGSTAPPSRTRPKRKRRPQKPGKTAKLNDRHFVVHNYHDHSQDKEEDYLHEELHAEEHEDHDEHVTHDGADAEEGDGHKPATKHRRRGGVSVPFPLKLHDLLDQIERDGLAGVISWLPHGRAFSVHKPREFVDVVMPRYFRQTKLTSFQRQLNLYGFQRLTRGPDGGGYYHELFLRDMPFLTKRMVRTKVKGTKFKAASSPDTEPDFYRMPSVNVRPSLYKGAETEASSAAAHVTPNHSDEDADHHVADCESSRDSSRGNSPEPTHPAVVIATVPPSPPLSSRRDAPLDSGVEDKSNMTVSPLASPAQLPKQILTFHPSTVPPACIAIPAGSFAPDMTVSDEVPLTGASQSVSREGSEAANVTYSCPTDSNWWINPDQAPVTDPDKFSPASNAETVSLFHPYQTIVAPKPSMDEDPIADFLKDWVESDVEDNDVEPVCADDDDMLSVSSDAFNAVAPVCSLTKFDDDDTFGRFLEEVVGV